MKKSIIVLLSALLVFIGCASTNVVDSSSGDNFKTVYDDVADVTMITHKDMELGYFYNLKDNISGERENIRLSIIGSNLVCIADYQYKDWMFINSLVFLDGKGGRLKIDNGNRHEEVKNLKNVFVRECYIATLDDDSVNALYNILKSDNPTVSFVGTDSRTDKLDIKKNVKSAMIATVEKWQSLKK